MNRKLFLSFVMLVTLAACGGGGGGGGGVTDTMRTTPTDMNGNMPPDNGNPDNGNMPPDNGNMPVIPGGPAITEPFGKCNNFSESTLTVEGVARFEHSLGDAVSGYGTHLHLVDGGNHGEDMQRVADECLAPRDNHNFYETGTSDSNPATNTITNAQLRTQIEAALTAADAQTGASVISVSVERTLGDAGNSGDGDSLQNNGDCRALLVVAAGNNGGETDPAQNYTDARALECGLIVAGEPPVMRNPQPADRFNPCGGARDDCIIGPADFNQIESIDQSPCDGRQAGCIAIVSGSSATTAATSSLLAAVAQRWTVLTPETLKDLALRCASQDNNVTPTARDGRGYLSLACLFNAQGQLVHPTTRAVITGHVSVAGLEGVEMMTGLDSFERDFPVPVAQPLSLVMTSPPSGTLLGMGPGAASLYAYSEEHRTGLALDGGLWRVDVEYIDRHSPLSPVRGTGAWDHGATLALTALMGSTFTLTPTTRALARAGCRMEHMMPQGGSLLDAYDATQCEVHGGFRMAMENGWSADVTGTVHTPRVGRVRLAERSVSLGGDMQMQARAQIALEW